MLTDSEKLNLQKLFGKSYTGVVKQKVPCCDGKRPRLSMKVSKTLTIRCALGYILQDIISNTSIKKQRDKLQNTGIDALCLDKESIDKVLWAFKGDQSIGLDFLSDMQMAHDIHLEKHHKDPVTFISKFKESCKEVAKTYDLKL